MTKRTSTASKDGGDGPKPITPPSNTVVPFHRGPVPEPKAIDPSRFPEPRPIRLPESHVKKPTPKPIAPPPATPETNAPRSLLDRLKAIPSPPPSRLEDTLWEETDRRINPPPPISPPARPAPRVEPIVPVKNPYDAKIDSKIDALMDRAHQLDPQTASNIRFRPRLDKAVNQTAAEWLNWGSRSLETLRTVTEKNSEFAATYARLNASDWIAQTRDAANKPPSFMDRFSRKPISFYETTLERIRGELQTLLVPLKKEIEDLTPRFETLRLDVLTFSVLFETLTDAHDMQVVQSRQRTLVNGQTSVGQILQVMENTRASVVQDIQTIDDLMLTLIPQWKIAESQKGTR